MLLKNALIPKGENMFDLKKILFSGVSVLIAGYVFAGDFAPTTMEINVPYIVQYHYDQSPLDIPIEISGVGGTFWLVINTGGEADTVNMVFCFGYEMILHIII